MMAIWASRRKKEYLQTMVILGVSLSLVTAVEAADLAEFYDNRLNDPLNASSGFAVDSNSVISPIRNQGIYGTCWTFAALASTEASWRMQYLAAKAENPALTVAMPDFSERYLAWMAYQGIGDSSALPVFESKHDPYNQGGLDYESAAMLTRGDALAWESDVPYSWGWDGRRIILCITGRTCDKCL